MKLKEHKEAVKKLQAYHKNRIEALEAILRGAQDCEREIVNEQAEIIVHFESLLIRVYSEFEYLFSCAEVGTLVSPNENLMSDIKEVLNLR